MLVFVIFIQEIDRVSSSSNVCVATYIVCVVLLSELVLDKVRVDFVGVEFLFD